MYFALFMVVVLAITGVIWLLDILIWSKKRAPDAADPVAVEYSKSFFPVILAVFLIRSFIVEPFKIPSGSMMPTLLAGDYILVNKYKYGLRVPILNNVFVDMEHPQRGDVIVFHYPPDPTIDYIKRVIGLPGDKIQYQDKVLTVNGQKLEQVYLDDYSYKLESHDITARRLQEDLTGIKHDILIHDVPNRYDIGSLGDQLQNGETITVPEGHYLAMGDNRDNSADSRVWGFVPDHNLVGKAFFIWFNFDQFGRIGNSIQ
ncbi:MAG TPA: signal peptidase I [Methylophilus sp.]|nr:signal peptidase I [Methylophilus sp.]HQQ33549.1 signal peptidase I [Methylophilus sp.]